MSSHAKVQEGHPILGYIFLSTPAPRHRQQVLRTKLRNVTHTMFHIGRVLLMNPDERERLCLLQTQPLKRDNRMSLDLLPRGMVWYLAKVTHDSRAQV
jgi:hypothetical protein